MKKTILSLIALLIFLTGFSQSLELYYEEELVEAGEELMIEAHADSGMISFHGLIVKNISTNPLNIKCAREVLEEVENTQNSFCWGICYSPTMDTSTLSLKIESNEITGEFVGDYNPYGNSGITKVRYVFYDMANHEDQIEVIVKYKASGESGFSLNKEPVNLSPIYPNPANNETNIDYDLKNTTGKVTFIIYNLLGSIVKEIEILDKSGSLKLNTSNLNEGIYFYSLLINNESSITQKLVIKH